jgi:RNA-directed DNA polymerase
MSEIRESQPETVPVAAKRTGESHGRWAWVEPAIWTERMLTALEQGVRGGKWFSLIDKVVSETSLEVAFRQVAANRGAAGVDHVTVAMYEEDLAKNLRRLSQRLRDGTYHPQPIRRHFIPKPGSTEPRPLGIPTVQDRVVQTALRMVLEPIFEREFAAHSYGFRPGRGCKDALRRVDELLKEGYLFRVDADLKSYFDTIPHDRLVTLIRQRVSDGRVLSLIEAYLKQGVLDGLHEWTPERGSPQGAVVSPLFSNLYLNPLDHLMARSGFEMVRYADDLVILCRSVEEAATALASLQQWVAEAGLTLHPAKTRVVSAPEEGFEFLGYRFEGGRRHPRTKSLEKFKAAIRAKTRRSSGDSLQAIITDVNRTLRGWFEYFKQSHRWTFEPLDRWIRRRLRSLLRRRLGLRGISRSVDGFRWPNAYFAEQGLYSLSAAHTLVRQSSRR